MTRRSILTLATPGAMAVAPAALALGVAPGSPLLARAAGGYPSAVLAAVALLGWRFQRSRIVAAAGALALAHALAGARGASASGLAVLLLSAVLVLLAGATDRRVGAPRGLLQVALGPVGAGAAALLLARAPAAVGEWLQRPLAAGLPLRPAPAAALLGLGLVAALALHRRRATEAGLFWAGVAGTLSLSAGGPLERGIWLLAAALALGAALVEAAHALAFRDELTELPGRRALGSLLGSLRPPYAVAIVDVDHFKRFNDRHGHDVGDQVLRMVAARLGRVGGGGQAFRSGGEEFTLVFPGCTREQALPHLEAVRRAVADTPFVPRRAFRPRQGAGRRGSGGGKRGMRVTVSVGVAAAAGRSASPEQVVKSADQAMYRAKQKGRNRVMA